MSVEKLKSLGFGEEVAQYLEYQNCENTQQENFIEACIKYFSDKPKPQTYNELVEDISYLHMRWEFYSN